jgi:hypothetical protein
LNRDQFLIWFGNLSKLEKIIIIAFTLRKSFLLRAAFSIPNNHLFWKISHTCDIFIFSTFFANFFFNLLFSCLLGQVLLQPP